MNALQAAASLPQPNTVIMCTAKTVIVEFIDSTIKQYEGYYISYNTRDKLYYGSDTTAIVIGQMQLFLILRGDHTQNYSNKSLAQLFQYYKDNIHLSVKSDDIKKFYLIWEVHV